MNDIDQQIQRFIAERGITRCPTAIAAPTPGVALAADDIADMRHRRPPQMKLRPVSREPNPQARPKPEFRHRKHHPTVSDLEAMRLRGMTYDAISRHYGCHRTTVMWWFKRFGLETKKGCRVG